MSPFHLPVHVESKASVGWCSVHPNIVLNCSEASAIQLQHTQCYLCIATLSSNCKKELLETLWDLEAGTHVENTLRN